jgi:hypothetical protein
MAGSWAGQVISHDAAPYAGKFRAFFDIHNTFTADDSNASVPAWTLSGEPGLLMEVGIVFDGVTPPDAATVKVKDKYGLDVVSVAFTASGRAALEDGARAIAGGGSVEVSNNTTNSAVATVILYCSSNPQ